MSNGTATLPRVLGKRLGSLPMVIGGAIAFVVAYGLNHGWKATFGPVLDKIGGLSIPTGIFGTYHPLRWLQKANADIERWFGDAQRYAEKGMVWGFNNFVELPLLLAGVMLAVGLGIFELGTWTTTYVRDALSAQHVGRVSPLLQSLAARTLRLTTRVERYVIPRLHAVEHRVAELARATAGTIASPFPRIGQIERDLSSVKARLKKAEKALAVGAGAALTLVALKRLGLGWLRCRNVTKTGKALCGMNPSLLESLLFDAAALTIAFNLETFAEELQTVTSEAASLIHDFAG